MRKGKKMETSEQRLINDDSMQAPLLAHDENNEDLYRSEVLSKKRKILFDRILINTFDI